MENQSVLIRECEEKAKVWTTSPLYDEKTQASVRKMLENPDKSELIDAFYRTLEFGTSGLRGIMGPGTNRMNIYTVGAATQGMANYLLQHFKDRNGISVAIGHDCRNNSRLFAETAAQIFSANGIKAYLFDAMRPTPEISFAIRHLGCQAGVILTASHNPKEYNGYKAYWDDGAQVLIQIIGEEIDREFLQKIHTLSIDPEVIKRQKDLSIVYTPIHGTGKILIPESLKLWGFENVHTVPEQMVESGDFPTVVSPNPENGEALEMAINLAKKVDGDIVMASDPDADRVGMACKDDKGEWVLINGNQTCMLFLYYIIKNRIAQGLMKGNEFIVKTIVTTELIAEIAKKNNIKLFDVYTGFKWIARMVHLEEDQGSLKYIGGGEESYGFMAEDFVRDKDAVSACSLLAEICAWAKDQGKTLYDVLMDIYLEYGFSYNKAVNIVKPGKSGAEEIKAMMENFRTNRPKELGGSKVILTKDFQLLKAYDGDGNETAISMPQSSNVLQWYTEDGTKVSVRPSGTEPKIKFYVEVRGEIGCANCYKGACADAGEKVEMIMRELEKN